MTKNKQLVTSSLITVILAANLVIGYQYNKDVKELEKKLTEQSKINTYRQELINDKRHEIDVLSEQLKTQQNEIHKLKKQLANAEKDGESPSVNISRGYESKPKIHMIATAYVSFCKGCIGITTSGIDVRKKIEHKGMKLIAVDPKVIPLHSIVKVYTKDSTFIAYATDTGGKIKGYKIDILVDTHDEQKAFEFGKQDVTVQMIREGMK